MNKFREKSLKALGDYYVYALVDPRDKERKPFYIGKGKGNRVFEHEKESVKNPNSDKMKHKTIHDITSNGYEVEKVILCSNLTETEAFAAEAALINAFNYIDGCDLTNLVAGHHSHSAYSVEDFDKIYGAEDLSEADITDKVLVIKINKLYKREMSEKELYDSVRGIWRASLSHVKDIDYVFGVYDSLIVAVYRPTKWYRCKDSLDKLPRSEIVITSKNENRLFFEDEHFEKGEQLDKKAKFYLGKSISKLSLNQSAQNPITYIE